MRTKEYVAVTHECSLGYFTRECILYSDPIRAEILSTFFRSTNVCEPGVCEYCNECPRNPEVGNIPEGLEPDRKFYYTSAMYEDAILRHSHGESVKMVQKPPAPERSWLERQEKEWKELLKKDQGNFLKTLK